MRRTLGVLTVATLGVVAPAFAQDVGGGVDRFELTTVPVGAVFFTDAGNGAEPAFGNYALVSSVAFKLSRRAAVEAEVGNAVGVRQDLTLNGQGFTDQPTPCLFAYSGNIILNARIAQRGIVPYAVGGVGGMRLLKTRGTENLGITSATNYLTGNAGGGLKWIATRHWGVRGDYRLLAVNDRASAPEFFGRRAVRYGHRVYAGLLLTY